MYHTEPTQYAVHLPDTLTLEQWKRAHDAAYERYQTAKWAWVDLLYEGRNRFGFDALKGVIEDRRLNPHTVSNLFVTRRHWPPERRIYDVSFSYYEAVSRDWIPAEFQSSLLRLAEVHDWNRDQLRDAVNKLKDGHDVFENPQWSEPPQPTAYRARVVKCTGRVITLELDDDIEDMPEQIWISMVTPS